LQQAEAQQGDALGKVKQQLQELATQSQSLSSETQRLRMVLSSNQARGRWGEETLRRVVEAAGLSAHCDFIEQVKEGESKPDMIVRLPGQPDDPRRFQGARSRFPRRAWARPIRCAAPKLSRCTRASCATRSRRSPIAIIRASFPMRLDHVVLFLPAESLFSAALEGDSDC
jgi:DNA recombination protein RmuC